MCLWLRKTESRGRTAVPRTATRIRRRRLARAASVLLGVTVNPLLGSGLADLAPNHFVHVLDPLPLVRIGLTEPPDLGGHLAHHRLVGPPDRELRLPVDLDLDSFRDLVDDGMGVSQVEGQGATRGLGPGAAR